MPPRSRRISLLRLAGLSCMLGLMPLSALEKPDITYPIYQFPRDQIPRIDGETSDWSQVPESYVIGSNQLSDDKKRHPLPDPKNLDVRVRVGWVKGLNRLYFLYEAQDDYWDFSLPDLHNDTFELVVDGDASGGPLIDRGDSKFWTPARVGESAAKADPRIPDNEAHWAIHGVHAQNYHIFTPPGEKDWCLAWGAATWIKEFPWANAVCRHKLKPGESGRLVLEFWITPFDYAGPEGPARAVESVLTENKIIGMAWAVMDYDNVAAKHSSAFWNLSPKHSMFGDASELCAFRLMPLEVKPDATIQARWSWRVADMARRLVDFTDESGPGPQAWLWDFGDGTTSTEQHPRHAYARPGDYRVTLEVEGRSGKSRLTKVWDIQLR